MEPGEFQGTIGRYHWESTPWWPEPVRASADAPECPADRARRRRLRAARLLRLRSRHADLRRARGRRAPLSQLPHDRALLAHPVVPDDRAQPPRQRHGPHHGSRDGLPRLRRAHPERQSVPLGDPRPARLRGLGDRQVAPHARRRVQPRGTTGPLAVGTRIRTVLRLLPAARRTRTRPPSCTTTTSSTRPGPLPTATTSPRISSTMRSRSSAICATSIPTSPSSPTSVPARATRRTRRRRSGATVPGAASTRAGTCGVSRRSRARSTPAAWFRPTPNSRNDPRGCRRGPTSPTTSVASTRATWKRLPATCRTPIITSVACSPRSPRPATSIRPS